MELQDQKFDTAAYQVEAALRDLRHLVGDSPIMSDAQHAYLAEMIETLDKLGIQASAMRQSLLTGEDPKPDDLRHTLLNP